MKAAGCDVFVNTAIPKFAAQAIKKAAEIEWKPLHILSSVGNSVAATLKPAGSRESPRASYPTFYLKDPTDPKWQERRRLQVVGRRSWTNTIPSGDKTDATTSSGRSNAATMVQVLKQCGDDLTRENVMKQAANLHDFTVPMLLPGITINTSPTDFAPVKQVQMGRFDGERWRLFGPLLTGAIG